MTTIGAHTAGPGRPPATDVDSIALVAVRLFGERGYDEVTMADIAAALGVGRTTLHRYFPTKGSILWVHHDEHDAEFRQALAETPDDIPIVEAVFDAYVRFLTRHQHEMRLAKGMVAVIVKSPPASTGKWTAFDDWGRYISEFVASRRGGVATDLENESLGRAIWAVLWTALEHWSVSDDEHPAAYLARARATIEGARAQRPAPPDSV